MTFLGRALFAAFATGMALAVLLVLMPCASAASEDDNEFERAPVTYIGAGSLRWEELSPQVTPTLWRLVGDSAVASMSVRSARDVTCPLDAWLSISSGSKALGANTTGNRSSLNPGQLSGDLPGSCPQLPGLVGGAVDDWSTYVDLQRDASGSYGTPGRVGQTLSNGGVCRTAIGRGAAVALADRGGAVATYERAWSRAAQRRCPVTMIDAGDLVGTYDDPTDAELRDLDALVSDVLDAAPRGAYVIVSGTADSEQAPARPQLGLQHRVGDTDPRWLTSETTRRTGYVQVIDIGATVLAAAGFDTEAFDARVMTPDGERDLTIAETVEDREEVAALSTVIPEDGPVFGAWIAIVPVTVLLASLVALVARRRGARWARHPSFVRVGIVAALFAAAIPSSLYLVTAARWWQSDHPTRTLAIVVVVIAAAITLLCYVIRWDRPYRFVAIQSGTTFTALTIDGLIGTPLQVGSLLAAGPVYGGRFFGFGNVTFVVYAVSALLVAAVVAQELRQRRLPRAAIAAASTIGGVAIVVDGWPTFGADFGGMLSLVPGVVVLVLMLANVRLDLGRLLVISVSGFLAVAVVAYLDYLRPAAERSHFGSFVARLRSGEAWDLLANKLDALLASVATPVGWLEVAAFTLAAAAVLRPAKFHVPELAALYDTWPTLRPALLAVVATCAIGSVVNDSGVLIAGLAVVVTVPPMIATCAWTATRPTSSVEVTYDGAS